MPRATTPLFETQGFGEEITHVQVFLTHITFQQRFGREITIPSHAIASVEERVYKNEWVILRMTNHRPIICMVWPEGDAVRPNRAAALCEAIRMCIAKKCV